MKTVSCPKGHGDMKWTKMKKTTTFKGVDVTYEVEAYVCPECGLEAGTVDSAAKIQRAIADAYRKKKTLLTGEEIRSLRQEKGLTQKDLADLVNVGVASIKRWETGLIQSQAMDRLLRTYLKHDFPGDVYSGNREFSIGRIKLVARRFEAELGKRLLKKGDKFLFLSKYLWYADMLSFRKLGRSMTGATYAALPYGPQINNYSDLIDEIRHSDESLAERLSTDELLIIQKIAIHFPHEQMVYDAAHREKVWKETSIGALIPYSRSLELTEISTEEF